MTYAVLDRTALEFGPQSPCTAVQGSACSSQFRVPTFDQRTKTAPDTGPGLEWFAVSSRIEEVAIETSSIDPRLER